MGLILAAGASLSSVLGDQWKEYFYCSELGNDVLMRKGEKHHGKSGLLNRGGSDNVITNGSTVVVNEGQCMIIVDQGAIVDICAEPGAYTYDTSSEPSIFSGNLGESLMASFKQFAARVSYGGVTPKDQRIYYFNTKDIIGNKYGTASPVPYRVVDRNINLDVDIAIRCFGEYAYRLADPILFYKHIASNVTYEYRKDQIENQLRTELLTALQPAFSRISDLGIRYSALPGHAAELGAALKQELSGIWGAQYGIEITAFGVSSVKASAEDEAMIKELQKTAVYKSDEMKGAAYTNAKTQAMVEAAKNQNAGPMMAFAGLNMAEQAGSGDMAAILAASRREQEAGAARMQASWKCPKCGTANTGKFCVECGTAKPAPAGAWKCPKCGTENTGKFCTECGTARPAAGEWACPKCGAVNTGKFCTECGTARE